MTYQQALSIQKWERSGAIVVRKLRFIDRVRLVSRNGDTCDITLEQAADLKFLSVVVDYPPSCSPASDSA